MGISDVISNVNGLADDGVAIDSAVVLQSDDQEVMSLAVGVVGEGPNQRLNQVLLPWGEGAFTWPVG